VVWWRGERSEKLEIFCKKPEKEKGETKETGESALRHRRREYWGESLLAQRPTHIFRAQREQHGKEVKTGICENKEKFRLAQKERERERENTLIASVSTHFYAAAAAIEFEFGKRVSGGRRRDLQC